MSQLKGQADKIGANIRILFSLDTLKPALEELKKTRFIKSYKWEEIKKFGKKEWKLTIKPWERFNIEFRQNSKIKELEGK